MKFGLILVVVIRLFIFVFPLADVIKNENKYTFEQFRGFIRQLNWARRKS